MSGYDATVFVLANGCTDRTVAMAKELVAGLDARANVEFRVLEAWNAQAALEWLKTRKVDAVITDLYMRGDLDGVGLIRGIRKNPKPHPAIIAMSGSPNLAYRSSLRTARYVGADATLTKPVLIEELVRILRELLASPRE